MFDFILSFLGLAEDKKTIETVTKGNDLKTIQTPTINENKEQKEESTPSLSFPVYSPEEYQKEKHDREDKAINGCEFFEPISIDIFEKNLEYFRDRKCPYCGAELPERKGKSYKCPDCKNKVYRLSAVASKFEGLYTEEEKEKQSQIVSELSKRRKFLKVYQNSCGLICFGFDEDKKQNIKRVMFMLHEARPYVKNVEKVNQLRMCRFYEAEVQELYGESSEALNAWLSVMYIDLWGRENYLYEYRNDYQKDFSQKDEEIFLKMKEDIEKAGGEFNIEKHKQYEIDMYNKTQNPFDSIGELCNITPYVYKQIFNSNKPLDILQGLFEFSAKEISKRVQYEPPITPQKAWEKILEYKAKEEEKE